MTIRSPIICSAVALCALAAAALFGSTAASAQQAAPESAAQAGQNLAKAQAETRAAYASKDKDAIAKARESERIAYEENWSATHPRKIDKAEASRRLAAAQATVREAQKSGSREALDKARADEHSAYEEEWAAEHGR